MEPHSQTSRGDIRTTVFAPHWAGFGGTHGGLVAASLQQAATDLLGGTPRSVTAHFLDAVPPGAAEIRVRKLRGGRSAASHASIDGLATALVRHTHGPESPPATWPGDAPFLARRPAPESLNRFTPPPAVARFGQHVDIRPLGASRPLAAGAEPAYDAWVRLALPTPDLDHLGTHARRLILVDAMPPGLFAVWDRPAPVPSLELSVHFAPCSDESPWHLVRHRTVWASADMCVDETTLHTRSGELAAQGRQLRRILPH
ncbi:hypothetical protein GCM10009799_01540 [Nocardiopsis rhodophaea]|uniref:Thioesterase family protein n=1 Tax=Nocardiopsis rhodophaea TaxID=280238 RepID=A0ABN2S4B8_9ACTN